MSIAKAGITTTLNTRTTLLAAANPAFGRYDVRRSPAENINLPAALLSRFDILWLILDRPSPEQDLCLANHVLSVHREGQAPPVAAAAAPLSPDMLRAYIAAAKQHEPHVPAVLSDYVAAVYAEMRAEEAASDMPHTYTTARTLLSILRLSQALARLRFADHVEQVWARTGLLLHIGCLPSCLASRSLAKLLPAGPTHPLHPMPQWHLALYPTPTSVCPTHSSLMWSAHIQAPGLGHHCLAPCCPPHSHRCP